MNIHSCASVLSRNYTRGQNQHISLIRVAFLHHGKLLGSTLGLKEKPELYDNHIPVAAYTVILSN